VPAGDDDDAGDADETTQDDLSLAGLKRSHAKMAGLLKESKEKTRVLANLVKANEKNNEAVHKTSALRLESLESRVQTLEDYYKEDENNNNQQSQPQRPETAGAAVRSPDAGIDVL